MFLDNGYYMILLNVPRRRAQSASDRCLVLRTVDSRLTFTLLLQSGKLDVWLDATPPCRPDGEGKIK